MILELSQSEAAAMLVLLKLGMDTHEGDPIDDSALEVLRHFPDPVLNHLIRKVSVAAGRGRERRLLICRPGTN